MNKVLLLALFLICTKASAVVELNLNGELDIASQLNFLPTSVQNNTAFSLQSLQLGSDVELKDDNSLHFLFEGAEKRDSTSHRFAVQMKEAYLDLVSPFPQGHEVRYGLVTQIWHESLRERFNYDFLGTLGKNFTEKNAYISHSDLGAMYLGTFANGTSDVAVVVSNGEGMESDETGPKKDTQIYYHWSGWAPFDVSLSYIFGYYEQYEPSLGKKERILLRLIYENNNGYLAGVELLDAHDPADVFTSAGMAQSVDLTSYNGQNVHGQGAHVFNQWRLSQKSELSFHYQLLNVVVGDNDKAMKTAWGGYSYQLTENIMLMAAGSYSWIPTRYGSGTRDQSALQLATQVTF